MVVTEDTFLPLLFSSLHLVLTLNSSAVAFVEGRREEGFVDAFQHFIFPFNFHASCTSVFGFILACEFLSFVIEQCLFWWSWTLPV